MQNILAIKIKELAQLAGSFTLRSDKTTDTYFDKYRFESRPDVLAEIASRMCEFLPRNIDKIAGLSMGGIPIATAISLRANIPCLFVRGKAKEYGTCNLIEGGFKKGERITIIEDIVTSGGAVIEALHGCRHAGLMVEHVICVIDREQGGRGAIEGLGCTLKSLFKATDLDEISRS